MIITISASHANANEDEELQFEMLVLGLNQSQYDFRSLDKIAVNKKVNAFLSQVSFSCQMFLYKSGRLGI